VEISVQKIFLTARMLQLPCGAVKI